MNAARRDRHRAGERRAALAADQIAAEIFHRQSTLVCHRGQLQNVDRLSIRLVREGVEQHVQIVDRRHRVVIFGQRHDRDARDLDCVAQAQRVAVFEVNRPDALTGVYNKENTQNMIDEILRKKDPDSFHGFLILDMDHFKEVNDVYGHAMGDKVLEMLGNFLKKQFREQDVIGRIGGDEFVILLYNIGSRQNMENRVKSLQEKIREIHMDGMEGHTFTLSAGIAFAPQDGDTFMELYQKADLALYQVKRSGRNGYRIYK